MPRAAKSAEVHALQGTESEAKPLTNSTLKPGRAKIPGHLSKAARAEFKRAQKILTERGHATPGDFVLLSLYAEAVARWIAEKNDVATRGLWISVTVLTSNGQPVQKEIINPSRKHAIESEREILALAKSLGLTPADRDKVKQTDTGKKAQVIPGSALDLCPELFDGGE
jgi:P27 family predicted phage terminase small subunit